MTIAIISMIRDNWGGSEELWAAMAEEALSQNHSVIHLSYNHKNIHPKLQQLINDGLIEIQRPGSYPQNISSSKKKILILLNYARKKINPPFKKVFKHKPAVVLYNGTCYSIAKEKGLLQYLRQNNAKLFILGHFISEEDKSLTATEYKELKKFYEYATQSLFIAAYCLRETKNHLQLPLHKAAVIRNPVNMPSTELIPYPQAEIIEFSMVGNLISRHKGQDIALETLSSETWLHRNWHLNIYGSGPDEMLLKEMTNKLNLQQRVTFHGRVTDIRLLWQRSHILLMPSRMEGMPLAVVEAMLCGRTCVVTDVGGHTEWIEENKEGFIAAEATVASFANALEKAWQQKENWMQLGINAHNKAMQLYDPQPGKTLLKILLNED